VVPAWTGSGAGNTGVHMGSSRERGAHRAQHRDMTRGICGLVVPAWTGSGAGNTGVHRAVAESVGPTGHSTET
jgi:hypothetical protein